MIDQYFDQKGFIPLHCETLRTQDTKCLSISDISNFSCSHITQRCLQVRVGGYRLPKDLGIGQFRELKPHEVRRVTDKAAQADPYL